MRIKRTDKGFSVRQKADRKINYAGQGKKYTEHATNFSAKEKQDALRQKSFFRAGTGVQAQKQFDVSVGSKDFTADDTAKSYQHENGDCTYGRRNKSGDYAVSGNLHVKKLLPKYRKESVSENNQQTGSISPEQCQRKEEQVRRPSSYHENTIKIRETVIHRKEKTPSGIRQSGGFRLKGYKEKKKHIQRQKHFIPERTQKTGYTKESRLSETFSGDSKEKIKTIVPASRDAQSFSGRGKEQISRYKRKKFHRSVKEKYQYRKGNSETTGRRADTGTNTETAEITKIPENCQETQPLCTQNTGEPALLQTQNPLSAEDASTSHIKKRNAGDSIRQRDGSISGRKDGADQKDKSSKKNKKKEKDTRKDNSHNKGKSRKDRAAAFRLLSYASDKFSQEEQKDSLLKAVRDIFTGKVKAAVTNALLSMGAALLPALIPAVIIVLIITLLFNSPFSILLPKLSEEPGAVEVLAEYTEDFREKVEEELADPGRADETELIYEDYEGDGEPDNMANILMVYMVKHGFGDTATVMTRKNKKALKDTFDEMTLLDISYRREMVEQSYEEEDFYGNITVKTEEVEITVKEVRITLLTSEDIIRTGIFTEEETEILRFLMLPEVLENIEGLTGGYGRPGAGSLTPEEEERLDLGGGTGSQAVKNALARLGKPYSQAKRDSGDYYDCSSLTYYAYREAGITLSYHGSNTAASQGQLLSDRGCEVAYEDIQPGDLIFYSFTRNGRYQNISHVAVYAGNGYLVDASSSKGCVVFRPVYSTGKIVLCGRPSWL